MASPPVFMTPSAAQARLTRPRRCQNWALETLDGKIHVMGDFGQATDAVGSKSMTFYRYQP